MGSPWETAIQQAMQRHSGSHRAVPKSAQSKPLVNERPASAAPPDAPKPKDAIPSGKPKTPAA